MLVPVSFLHPYLYNVCKVRLIFKTKRTNEFSATEIKSFNLFNRFGFKYVFELTNDRVGCRMRMLNQLLTFRRAKYHDSSIINLEFL